jgi:hypothetical protein
MDRTEVPSLKLGGGNWVVGERFWDREAELRLFAERLDDGAHLLVVAPRRIGKTSLLKEAARRLEGRYLCIYIDLQKAYSAPDAIVELSLAARPHAGLWDKVKSVFRNVLRDTLESIKIDELTITLRSGLTSGDWQAKGDRVLEILAGHDRPVVLLFDEVPILVNRLLKGGDYEITPERRQATDAFLSWLRSNSIRHQGKLRMVITGSIGLEPPVRQAGLSATLTTFTSFKLGPWNRETAAGCLRALANGYGLLLRDETVDEMLDRLTWYIPHHVEMFFEHAYQAARLRNLSEVSKELAAEVYQESMLGIRGHAELSHMEERLKVVLGPDLDVLALDLLTEAAVTGGLSPQAATVLAREYLGEDWQGPLRDILNILEHDGYLSQRQGVYEFESGLLRDWWKARFWFAFVPAAKRETYRRELNRRGKFGFRAD